MENEIKRVKKRNGELVLFNEEEITESVFKAVKAVGEDDYTIAKSVSKKVTNVLSIFFKSGHIPTVENIQDLIEKTLVEEGHFKIAKAYILYREQHSKLRHMQKTLLDIEGTMNEYLKNVDWRVSENSNVGFSVGGLILYISGKITANYWLNNIYPPEVSEAHKVGDYHLHDLSMFTGYCAGWSLKQLLEEGFGGVRGHIQTVPPKHLDTATSQMVNFLGTLQNEWAGAQAFSSVDTYLAPFVKADNLTYKETKQCIQKLIFHLATPSRWGTQTPFINFTFDWTIPDDMYDKPAIVGGKEMNYTYGDCKKEMDMLNKAFIEVMIEGDASGRIFTFPIPTYNITRDFDWNSENATKLFEMTAKYGIPYFQNFVNSELKPSDVRSMCCRLQLDKRELRKKTGGLFGNGELTGSVGVVTINMPRIGYLSETEEELFERLGRLMDIAKNSLELKRKVVEKYMQGGLLPFTRRYLGTLDNHFNTIGLLGMNELLLNFLGPEYHIATRRGKDFAEKVLDFMREKLQAYQEETGHMYNLEATPAEGCSYRLAKMDKEKYADIITAGTDENPYYTNSSQLPVNFTQDIFEALELQDSLQTRYTGGTVLHGFLGEQVSDVETCKKLVKRIAYNFRLPYFTITPTFSVCPVHGYISGNHETCPYDEGAVDQDKLFLKRKEVSGDEQMRPKM